MSGPERVLDLIEDSPARAHEQGGQDYETTLLASSAISLKRIADAVDRVDFASFSNQLLDLAYQAGQNFRGRQ